MNWHDAKMIAALVTALVTIIPFALTFVAARVGYKQVREFHDHTGDESLLTSIAAFSRFHEEPKAKRAKVEEPEGVC
ncbi:MAG TPA: hypothetical protein VHE36_00060 [Sphingomicrobium sp.]|jgi:hypothetical protein|nr:hypothetical protein [Sphingomicrobium sp.]